MKNISKQTFHCKSATIYAKQVTVHSHKRRTSRHQNIWAWIPSVSQAHRKATCNSL